MVRIEVPLAVLSTMGASWACGMCEDNSVELTVHERAQLCGMFPDPATSSVGGRSVLLAEQTPVQREPPQQALRPYYDYGCGTGGCKCEAQAQRSEDEGGHSQQGVSGEPVPFITAPATADAVVGTGKEEQGAGAGSGAGARQTPRPEQDPEALGTGGSRSQQLSWAAAAASECGGGGQRARRRRATCSAPVSGECGGGGLWGQRVRRRRHRRRRRRAAECGSAGGLGGEGSVLELAPASVRPSRRAPIGGQAKRSRGMGGHSLRGVGGQLVPFTTALAARGVVMDAGGEEPGLGAGSRGGAGAGRTPPASVRPSRRAPSGPRARASRSRQRIRATAAAHDDADAGRAEAGRERVLRRGAKQRAARIPGIAACAAAGDEESAAREAGLADKESGGK